MEMIKEELILDGSFLAIVIMTSSFIDLDNYFGTFSFRTIFDISNGVAIHAGHHQLYVF